MWSDAGQHREMLPLRLVHAAKDDWRARILDDYDNREPRFYTGQLVADFEPGASSAPGPSPDRTCLSASSTSHPPRSGR